MRAILGFAIGLVLVGCGANVETSPTGSGGSGGSASTSSGTGGAGGTGAGGAGGACAAFADEPGSGDVQVRFVNESPMDVYIERSCSSVVYSIDHQPADANRYVYDGSCLQTCEDLETQPRYACGACAPTVQRIKANGGTFTVTWEGLGLQSTDMPAACWLEGPGGACDRKVSAPAGMYSVTATGQSGCDSDPVACTCDAHGVCNGFPTGAQAYSDPVTLQVPGAGSIDVVFGPCAFGCPGGE